MNDAIDLGHFVRPKFQLRSLPINIRWEVTRRHPVYQAFWRPVNWNRDFSDEDQLTWAKWLDVLSDYLLIGIGIGGLRPNPSVEFSLLEADHLNAAWLTGAVHPMTNRQLSALLMDVLPAEALGQIGQRMMYAAHAEPVDGESRRSVELRKLNTLEAEGLDSYLDEPFVSINPAASARDINACLNDLLIQWKEERGLTEKRTPMTKLASYLQIWDAREGWWKGNYDRSREETFRSIANKKKMSINTIHNQYKSAYKLITGYEYSIKNWIEVFGSLKFSEIFGPLGCAARLRPLGSRTTRDIPDSVISSSNHPAFIGQNAQHTESSTRQLLEDIKSLIARGKSNDDIEAELELQNPEYLDQIRSRIEDGLI